MTGFSVPCSGNLTPYSHQNDSVKVLVVCENFLLSKNRAVPDFELFVAFVTPWGKIGGFHPKEFCLVPKQLYCGCALSSIRRLPWPDH